MTKLDPKHRRILERLVWLEQTQGVTRPHVEAGNSGYEGTAPFGTLRAMANRGLVELGTSVTASIHGRNERYSVAYLTDAGRAAVAESTTTNAKAVALPSRQAEALRVIQEHGAKGVRADVETYRGLGISTSAVLALTSKGLVERDSGWVRAVQA